MDDGVEEAVVEMIPMILHLHILGRDMAQLSKRVGDLAFGLELLRVQLGATWLELGITDNRRHRGAIHGLVEIMAQLIGKLLRLDEAARAQAPLQGMRALDLGRRREDRSLNL